MPVFYTNTGSLGNLQVSGSTIISASTSNLITVIGSGSSILTVSGSSGPILEVSDVNVGNPKILVFSSGSGASSVTVFSIETNKRVEISGSLVVTGSITGSLLGTASYATSALTASFALNAGGSTTNRISSGSVSASVNVGNADTFRIISASSTFVYVSASGNVGIGTTTPNATFNIVTPPADTTGKSFIFKGSNSKEFVSIDKLGFISTVASDTNGANIHFYDNSNTKRAELSINSTDINWYSDALASNFLVFKHSTGNVGIGATDPLTKLEVRSGVITAGSNSSTEGIEIIRGYYTAGALTVIGSERSNGGPVIGYAVKPSNTAADEFLSSTSINVPRGAYTIAGADHKWYTGSAQTVSENSAVTMGRAMTLTSTGFLGLATTAPTARLDVNGTISLSGGLFARLAGNYMQLYTSGSTNIGLYLGGSGDAANYYDNTNHYFRDIGGSSTYMHITNAANVGINKTNPNAKLDVNGDSFITGSTRITGSLAVVGNLTVSTGSGTFDRGLFVTRSFKVVDQALLNSFEANPDGNVVTSINLDVTHNVRESVDAFVIYDTLNSRTAFRYNNEALNFIIDPASQNSISIGKQSDPTAKLDVSGSVKITGSLDVSQGVTASLFGTSSWALNVVGGASSFPFTGSARITGSLNVVGSSTITGSLVVSGANGAGIFSQGATLVDYLGGITNSASYMVWRAPFSCSVVALYGYYVGGTSPQVNAFRSGSSGIGRLTGSNLTLTAQNVWSASITTGLANTDFNVGDSLQVVISGSSNNQVAVQVDFIRKF